MKYSLLLTLAVSSIFASAQIPKNVIREFERIQPGARFVEWRSDKGLLKDYYRVTYTNWYRQTLVFNRQGQIVISESELPEAYIPNEIHKFIQKKYPNTKYVVWDSFDEKNSRSYFVICNEERKVIFNDRYQFKNEVMLAKPKNNLLTITSAH